MKKKIRIKVKKKPKKNKPLTEKRDSLELKKQQLKKNKRRNKLKRRFYIFTVFFILVGITAILFKAPFFNISEVICIGQEQLTEEEILKAAQVEEGKNIFLTNISDVKERVAAIPRVSESNARRIFPNKVKIWVREAVPCLAVEKDGKFAVCDKNTKVLEIADENKDNLCVLKLSDTKDVKPGDTYADINDFRDKKLLELIDIMENLGMINLSNYIDFSDISDIIILYDSRLKIKIGNTNDLEYKLKFINEIIWN